MAIQPRHYGMDHDYWQWSPIVARPPLRWPNGERLAVCLLVDLGHYEWQPREGAFDAPSHTAPMSLNNYPDYPTVTYREFGHRVGIFRVMEVLDRHGVKATVPMDAYTAEHYPTLVDECQARGWELIGHGVTQRDAITSLMSEEQEREYIGRSLDALRRASGGPVRGWLGPEYCESDRTPRLLAEQGIQYVCDLPNDEQPYPVTTPAGLLTALPVMIELGDVMMHFNRKVTIQHWSRLVREAADTMYRDGRESGRLLVLNLHPWCVGQAWRVKYLDEIVSHLVSRQGIWLATGSQVDAHFRALASQPANETG